MKSLVKVLGVALVLALLVPVIGTAKGQEKKAGNAVSDAKALAVGAKVTLAAALDKALKAAPGTAIAAELENEENLLIFTFDILPKLTSEEITEIHVDAKTGAVVKAAEETEKEEAEGKEAEAAEGAGPKSAPAAWPAHRESPQAASSQAACTRHHDGGIPSAGSSKSCSVDGG